VIRQAALYGGLLAAGALALTWLDYQHLVLLQSDAVYIGLIGSVFLALGAYVGATALRPSSSAASPDGNERAQTALGISAREMDVLRELAAGGSTKEIAQRLGVSPNTVKTHISRLFEKLGAKRRTDAICRARELGLVA
jgi:DNA-binding NarL/FixJ family response regulator